MTTQHTRTVDTEAVATQPLQMIRGSVDERSFQRWAGSGQLMSRHAFDEGYAMHCFLAGVFGELAPKPFRLIFSRPKDNRRGVFYGYSRTSVAALREAAAQFADPLQARVLPGAGLDSKPMPTTWKAGTRLGFEVLTRPTVRRARGSKNAGAEIDAFQWEAERFPPATMPRSREDVYTDWLSQQFERHGGAGTGFGEPARSFQTDPFRCASVAANALRGANRPHAGYDHRFGCVCQGCERSSTVDAELSSISAILSQLPCLGV